MNSIIFVIVCGLILLALVKYNQHTTERALRKRWKLINFINPILEDENYTDDFKNLLLTFYYESMSKNITIRILFTWLYLVLFKKEENQKNQDDFMKEIIPTEELKNTYQEVLKIVLEINFNNAPHWYLLGAIISFFLIVIYFIFSKATYFANKINFDNIILSNISTSSVYHRANY